MKRNQVELVIHVEARGANDGEAPIQLSPAQRHALAVLARGPYDPRATIDRRTLVHLRGMGLAVEEPRGTWRLVKRAG